MDSFVREFLSVFGSVKTVLFALLVSVSLGATHYVTFSFAIPSEMRVFLDTSFRLDFSTDFFIIGTFSVLVARYLPQTALALLVLLIEFRIKNIYFFRGYKRVASPLMYLQKEYLADVEAKKRLDRKIATFTRNDARLSNFVRSKVQSILPILWFEGNKWLVTLHLSILVSLFFYVGLTYAMLLFVAATIVLLANQAYQFFNDRFMFRLSGYKFKGDDPDYQPPPHEFDASDLLLISVTCAVVFAIAGPLRLERLKDQETVTVETDDGAFVASIIGTTTHGILAFDGGYLFVPFSSVHEVR